MQEKKRSRNDYLHLLSKRNKRGKGKEKKRELFYISASYMAGTDKKGRKRGEWHKSVSPSCFLLKEEREG